MPCLEDYAGRLDALAGEGRLRTIPPDRSEARLIDLSSNDYLGLAARYEEFLPEFRERFGPLPMSASASRLLATRQDIHSGMERYLESLYGRPALLFNSGYHANVGIVSALNTPETLFLVDRQIHASAYDGLTLRGAEFRRFPHNDMARLRRLLEQESTLRKRVVVIVESVYSMEGDRAPLRQLAEMRREFPSMILYVDEAHAFGCFGRQGLGAAEEEGVIDSVDILMATFGKAGASVGAFCITSPLMRDWLVNTARPFIFSTALPPANIAWSRLMTEKIVTMEAERIRLCEISRRLKHEAEEAGFRSPSESQIIPVITGDAARAVALSEALASEGILALPIRRPTVGPGEERVRLSLNASLTDDEISRTAAALHKIGGR